MNTSVYYVGNIVRNGSLSSVNNISRAVGSHESNGQ